MMRKFISATATTMLLTGCMGKNFVRPTPGMFHLGETRYEEIRKTYGDPGRGRSTVVRNGVPIKKVPYVYVSEPLVVAFGFGSIRVKSTDFYFDKDDVLVGYDFSSSFPSESTDFKEADVEKIKKGQTTCKQVTDLFGPLGGEYSYPMVGEAGDKAVVYYYSEERRGVVSNKRFEKSLSVVCDRSDVVKDVSYSYNGEK
jgi:hypothetical protein